MAAGSSSNGASDQNKRLMKRQATNPREPVIDAKTQAPEKCHQHRSFATDCRNVRKEKPSCEDHQDLVEKVNLLQKSHDSCRQTQHHMLSLIMDLSNRLGVFVEEVKKGKKEFGEDLCRLEGNQEKDDSDQEMDDGHDGGTHDRSLQKEKPSEYRKRRRDASVQTDSDEHAHGDNLRLPDDPAPLYDSFSEPLSQKHLDKVETAFVVHTLSDGEISGEVLIYFLKDGRTMKINQVQLLLFKEQLELEYLVHLMHERSFVHRRWINNMKTRIRQVTRLLNGTREEYFRPKYVCDEGGREKEMPRGSVKIQHDQLGTYVEYTQSQVGMSSITLDDIYDYDYTPSELRAAYWQITGADDESVTIKRILKKALENAELKLLGNFLEKNPSFSEIPDSYELEH